MPLTPILEVIVLWHPDDAVGNTVSERLIEHFHGPAYAGLAGGAVEVYIRSAGWNGEGTPPRPLAAISQDASVSVPQFTVVIPILGRGLARAVRDSSAWHDYVQTIFTASSAGGSTENSVVVFPLVAPNSSLADGVLDEMARATQYLPRKAATSRRVLTREVSQAIAQAIIARSKNAGEDERTTIFISHTKQTAGKSDAARALVALVREVLDITHLGEFFDASDLQPGSDWQSALDSNAGQHALLMMRTDLYSSREWTQREVYWAKLNDVPIVCAYAVRDEERRGSFLMDHVPVVACLPGKERKGVERALGRLVDETLKRALWRAQTTYVFQNGFDWLPVHSPELLTTSEWLKSNPFAAESPRLVIMHPDPPLQPQETAAILDLCELAGAQGSVDIFTPRTFAMRGGRLT